MFDPAPTFIECFTELIRDLVDGDSLFDGFTFAPLGSNECLEEPYAIVTYESSEQVEFTQNWETVMLVQFHMRRPTTADYETTPIVDQTALEQQARHCGAQLLRKLCDWFETSGRRCVGGWWMTQIGRGINLPHTTEIGEDKTFVHETRWTIVSRYHPDMGTS